MEVSCPGIHMRETVQEQGYMQDIPICFPDTSMSNSASASGEDMTGIGSTLALYADLR